MVRILIVDDQQLVRTGFRMILADETQFEVVAEAQDGSSAVKLATEVQPDVVLMDIRMPGGIDGIEATRRIVALPGNGKTKVLILTTFDLDEYVFDALRAGASGFLLKDVPAHHLISGIQIVADGDALLAPSITKRLIGEFAVPQPAAPLSGLTDLTARELEVFMLIARGQSNSEIAETLILGNNTIKTHVTRILAKLRARDRVHLVVMAYEAGVVKPGAGQE
ncbi:MAG TPA: response regulator transcription factor [Nitrolancea sp.]|jgi:DNA-binding NarL/FixJ family response regulator|nr:response regulator transcription factor [Nitrolancea sp.]